MSVQQMSIQEMSVPDQILLGGFFIAFLGETGCGKTTCMTWFAFWVNERLIMEESDLKLFTNYDLIDIPEENLHWNYEKLKHPDQLIEIVNDENIKGFAFIDELWRWHLDSYGTLQNARKKYDDVCANARKGGIRAAEGKE